MDPVLLGPGEGEVISRTDTRSLLIKAEHELVHATETWYGAGERGAQPHVHLQHADVFYMLSGELEFVVGGGLEPRAAGPGTLVLVPPGVVHGFDNGAASDAHFLNFHAPSRRFVEYLRARRDGEQFDPERFDIFDPPADGGRPAEQVVVRGPGDGETITVGPNSLTIKVGVDDGPGSLLLAESRYTPGFVGPPPHMHEAATDGLYVREGTLTLQLGERTIDAGPGSFAFVPPGVVHTFSNRGKTDVDALNVMAPAGFEHYWAPTPSG